MACPIIQGRKEGCCRITWAAMLNDALVKQGWLAPNNEAGAIYYLAASEVATLQRLSLSSDD